MNLQRKFSLQLISNKLVFCCNSTQTGGKQFFFENKPHEEPEILIICYSIISWYRSVPSENN